MSEEREGARPSYTAYQVNDGPEGTRSEQPRRRSRENKR